MAIFSRITAGLALAYIASSSLLISPVAASDSAAVGAHNARRVHKIRDTHFPKSKRAAASKKTTCSSAKKKADDAKKAADAKKTADNSGGNSGGGNGSNGKAGLAWNDGTQSYMQPFTANNAISWCYSWSPWSCCSGHDWCPEFIPMFWSDKQAGDWKAQVMGKSWQHILHVNEPDQSGQSSMTVGEAISLWHQYIAPVNAKSKGAPAVTASPDGKAWIKQFMDQCDGCGIGFIPFHYYGMDADDFIENVKWFHTTFPGYSIWVTEWGCQNYGNPANGQCSQAQVNTFLKKSQAFLNSASYVGRYAYFGSLTEFPYGFNTLNRLISSSGATTDLGHQYINDA